MTSSGNINNPNFGTGVLTLSGANDYTGDTTVNSGKLAVNGTALPNDTKLTINGGKVALTNSETVNTLFFGTFQQDAGTWGSSTSVPVPDHVDDTRFSGTGILIVRGELILPTFAIVGNLRRVAPNSLVTYNESFRSSCGYPDYTTLDTTAIAWMMCDNFLNGIEMQDVEKQYQPQPDGYSEEVNHASRWDPYDVAAAAATANRAQQIIDLYFPPPTSADYTTWTAKYPAADLTDLNADLDGDGLSNDQERIWGLNPASAASRNPVTFSSNLATGNFTYTRRTRSLTGLTCTVWTSPDLVAWTRDGGAVQTPGAAADDVETVFVTLTPALVGAPKLFVQVRAAP